MTIIAYRDGIIASDSQETHSDGRKAPCKKIYKSRDGVIIGTAGDSYTGLMLVDWFERGARLDDAPDLSHVSTDEDFECLIVESRENIYTMNRFFQRYDIELMNNEFYAIGCGSGYAMVAMEMGATAKEAVKVTCKYDAYCGGNIQVMKVK